MRRFFRAALPLMLICLLSGCSTILNVSELLSPPPLTAEQEELYTALEMAVGSDDIQLKYPRSGEYLSAFILYDIDRDGTEEALTFYDRTVSGQSSTWLSILVQESEGGWRSAYEVSGPHSDIDFVEFTSITGGTEDNIIVGWTTPMMEERTVVVYTPGSSHLVTMFSDSYSVALTEDIDEDGRTELILCTAEDTVEPTIKLCKYRDGKIDVESLALLPEATVGFSQVIYGRLSGGLEAVFADVILDSSEVATVTVAVDRTSLIEIEPQELSLDNVTRPQGSIDCTDINGDGFIDIPFTYPMPGYETVADLDKVYRTDFYSMATGSMTVVAKVVVNTAGGYAFLLPELWDSEVSIVRMPDGNEWQFVVYEDTLGNSSQELLRIKTVLPGDYVDKFDMQSYVEITSRGNTDYLAYIPTEGIDGLSITIEQLRESFILI